jgi:hypothetical protein
MTSERLAGYLSYKDQYNRYHVTMLPRYNSEKWEHSKDHFSMKMITKKYEKKLQSKLLTVDKNYTICTPWERYGFYFVINKDKTVAEKIYETKENVEECDVDDLLGYPIIIDAKVTMYKTPKFEKVGCKIQACYVRNLEPILDKNTSLLY